MTVYMEVTRDEYELPLAVADTLSELAKMRDTTASNICKYINKSKKIEVKHRKYLKVEIEEDVQEESQ